jgi:hypothetical protein
MTSFRHCAAFLAFCVSSGCGARIVNGPDGGPENVLAVGSTIHGELGPSDPLRILPMRSSTTSFPTDVYSVQLTAGEPVTLTMCEDLGADIDPYLVVAFEGSDVHLNDDSAGGYHGHGSLITFTPSITGAYDLYASSFRSQLTSPGAYTIRVMAGLLTTFRCPS